MTHMSFHMEFQIVTLSRLFKVDIHYIKLYHIQVDITKNREPQKPLNTKLVQINNHSSIQFPPSHFPSHLLIFFLLSLLDLFCEI